MPRRHTGCHPHPRSQARCHSPAPCVRYRARTSSQLAIITFRRARSHRQCSRPSCRKTASPLATTACSPLFRCKRITKNSGLDAILLLSSSARAGSVSRLVETVLERARGHNTRPSNRDATAHGSRFPVSRLDVPCPAICMCSDARIPPPRYAPAMAAKKNRRAAGPALRLRHARMLVMHMEATGRHRGAAAGGPRPAGCGKVREARKLLQRAQELHQKLRGWKRNPRYHRRFAGRGTILRRTAGFEPVRRAGGKRGNPSFAHQRHSRQHERMLCEGDCT